MADKHALTEGMQDCPPLPGCLAGTSRRAMAGDELLADGCYSLAFGLPVGDAEIDLIHVGTLRVDSRSGGLTASADLYEFDSAAEVSGTNPQRAGVTSPRGSGIAIFPIKDYRLYLRVTRIEATDAGFVLAFEAHRFLPSTYITLDCANSSHWVFEGTFAAYMVPSAAPPGYPRSRYYFVGDVCRTGPEGDGPPTGRMQMGWVSPALRRAVVEIDRVPGAVAPLDNGEGLDWQGVFQSVGWEVTPIVSDDNVTKHCDSVWDKVDAEAARQKHRDSSDLDTEWRYYLLVASLVDAPGSNFGFMYRTSREAAFITSQYVFPPTEAQWGDLRGERFDTTVAFFRTAVHEVGHAMGLGHNTVGCHLMRPTEKIAQAATADRPFPANIEWSFDPDDEQRLRHWPDIMVRPGGASYSTEGPLPPGPL